MSAQPPLVEAGGARGVFHPTQDARHNHLSEETLDELRDGHPAGNSVRVNDDIRHDTVDRPGHVLLPVRHPDRTLLPVPGRELVADLWDAHVADTHLKEDGGTGK